MGSIRKRASHLSLTVAAISVLLLAWVVIPAGAGGDASGHPHKKLRQQAEATGLGLVVNSPADLVGFHPGVQWGDTGEVDFQTAELVYAGTGCTPASYAPVADLIQGNIALVDDRVSQTNPSDQCPTYTFMQKVQSAEKAGAIGFVQIPAEGEEPAGNSTAITAEIPALELERTDALLAVRDAVIAGTVVDGTLSPIPSIQPLVDAPCVNGMAGPFPCKGVDLLSFVPQETFDGAGVSDIWGWTDPATGDEYVFFGKTNGTAFFRVTDPTNPVYLGELPNPAVDQVIWHDMKVFKNHAFIVSESNPHGMTVFDLTRLRDVHTPQQFTRDAWYPMTFAAHNIAINEETGFAYLVGGNAGIVVPDVCLSGLHMVDINDPKNPTFAGCYQRDGGPGTAARTVGDPVQQHSPAAYVHDTECTIYRGPDQRYAGREICFNSSENKIVIVDVTDKVVPQTIGMTPYPDVNYSHQAWLTDDQTYLIANDELDEVNTGTNTRTIVFDVSDLENPKVHFIHVHDTTSIDHNNYVDDGLLYQSNYTSGLRVLDTAHIDDPANPRLEPLAFFDVFPAHSNPTFDGTWSNYPFFESGTIAVTGIGEGLFLLRLQGDEAPPGITLTAVKRRVQRINTVDLAWEGATSGQVDIVRDGAIVATVANDGSHTDSTGERGSALYKYRVCEAGTSTCSNEVTVIFGSRPPS
jgi:choice-of-anchor B domain-containing protein